MITRTEYTKQLESLSEHVARLGEQTLSDIRATQLAIVEGDDGAARGIIDAHHTSDQLRRSIEDGCMSLMLLQQPLARDLRLVTASFRAVPDLARIDEMCADIAVLSQELPNSAARPVEGLIDGLVDGVATMVERAMDAFLTFDADAAERVFDTDADVDRLYAETSEEIVRRLRKGAKKNSGLPELLMVAKYYERMGDHAQSIADWAIFNASGEYRGQGIGEADRQ